MIFKMYMFIYNKIRLNLGLSYVNGMILICATFGFLPLVTFSIVVS